MEQEIVLDERPERAADELSEIAVRLLNERDPNRPALQVRYRRHTLLAWLHLQNLASCLVAHSGTGTPVSGKDAALLAGLLYGRGSAKQLKNDLDALNAWLLEPGRRPAGADATVPPVAANLRSSDGRYRFRGRSPTLAEYLRVLTLAPGYVTSDLDFPDAGQPGRWGAEPISRLLNLRATRASWNEDAVIPGGWLHEQGSRRFQLRLPLGAFDLDSPYRTALAGSVALGRLVRALVQESLQAYTEAMRREDRPSLGAPCAWLMASVALACEFAPHLHDLDVSGTVRAALSEAPLGCLMDLRSQLGAAIDQLDQTLDAAAFGFATRGEDLSRYEEWRREFMAVRARAAALPERRRERDRWRVDLRNLLKALIELIRLQTELDRPATPTEKLVVRREIEYGFEQRDGEVQVVIDQRKHYVLRAQSGPLERTVTRVRPTNTSGHLDVEQLPQLIPIQPIGLPHGTVAVMTQIPHGDDGLIRTIEFTPPVHGLIAYTLASRSRVRPPSGLGEQAGWSDHALELEHVNGRADVQRLELQLRMPLWYPLIQPAADLGLRSHVVVLQTSEQESATPVIDQVLTELAQEQLHVYQDLGADGQPQHVLELSLFRPVPGRYGFVWRKPSAQDIADALEEFKASSAG